MLRSRPALLLFLLALGAIPATAAPLQITGKVLHPPKDVQVELRPWAADHAEGFAPAESRVVVTPGGTVHLDVALGASP